MPNSWLGWFVGWLISLCACIDNDEDDDGGGGSGGRLHFADCDEAL